jgi:hypothetical protein
MKKKLLIIVGAPFVAGVASAGIPYVSFPVAITTDGGMGLNYLKTLSTLVGTVSTEANSAYKASEAPQVRLGRATRRGRTRRRGIGRPTTELRHRSVTQRRGRFARPRGHRRRCCWFATQNVFQP